MPSNGFASTFREEALDLLASLEALLLDLEQSPRDRDLIDQVFRAMHTLKGSGSMFGFDDVVAVVHEIETVFDLVRAGRLEVTPDLIARTLQARDQIRLLVDHERGGEAPNMALIGQLVVDFRTMASRPVTPRARPEATGPAALPPQADGEPISASQASAEGAAGPSPSSSSEPTPGPRDGAMPPLASQASQPLRQEAPTEVPPSDSVQAPAKGHPGIDEATGEPPRSPTTWSIRFAPHPGIFLTGNNPVGILKELAELGPCEVRPDLSRLPALNTLDPESCYLAWDILLHTHADLNAIRDVFLFVEDHAQIDITPTEAAFQAGASRAATATGSAASGPTVDPRAASPSDPPAGAAHARANERPASTMSPDSLTEAARPPTEAVSEGRRDLRISAEKLDRLVELIGELVTVQARISQVAARRNDAELTSLAEELERLSADLRDRALKIRMLPIGATFEALRATISETARGQGKDLRVVMQGTETELDKDVIERLGAPLGQLVRLAVIHSLENPARRTAGGKAAQAMLSLTARHFGGNFCIEVRDDGQGFDPAALRARAQALGLPLPADELAGQELLRLLCQPGFFAEGGLGEVKAVIDDLRGTLEIENRPGQGLTFLLRLPLTLAIIEGLVVALGSWHFVLPLAAVEECIELTRETEARTYRKNVVMVRDQIVPYIPLREKFAVDGQAPAIQQIVIASVGQHRVGFVVDQVIGEFQTVIKPLGSFYKNVKGISGATIMGDGSVALIIDLTKIVQEESHVLDLAQQGG
ncbi:MAG: Signal transduction histidine kinase CheA [Candidatus Ozemobacter sibiricus]|uniref:histidine kinase n=1 Tax=Candidatus Ozemobacter sibiricus TaxID=2268124 RepID=A0A367ZNY8_9BACT|nr:MAG: Signal transduction histidine kinase CheA [Candidatus Ozemobacter sibiricus]